jgi:hypothetical protein
MIPSQRRGIDRDQVARGCRRQAEVMPRALGAVLRSHAHIDAALQAATDDRARMRLIQRIGRLLETCSER